MRYEVLPEDVSEIVSILRKISHPLVLQCRTFRELQDCVFKGIRNLFPQYEISGRICNNVVSVGLQDEVCVDQELKAVRTRRYKT
jgi:hypothetical protein